MEGGAVPVGVGIHSAALRVSDGGRTVDRSTECGSTMQPPLLLPLRVPTTQSKYLIASASGESVFDTSHPSLMACVAAAHCRPPRAMWYQPSENPVETLTQNWHAANKVYLPIDQVWPRVSPRTTDTVVAKCPIQS